jgi:hypothetical protein
MELKKPEYRVAFSPVLLAALVPESHVGGGEGKLLVEQFQWCAKLAVDCSKMDGLCAAILDSPESAYRILSASHENAHTDHLWAQLAKSPDGWLKLAMHAGGHLHDEPANPKLFWRFLERSRPFIAGLGAVRVRSVLGHIAQVVTFLG